MSAIHSERVEALRTLMREKGWDAVVLRGSDPHRSEYLAPRYQAVTWLSGFTGEAADVVVTLDEAGLWTDSRYFIQAVAQLQGSGIVLHKTRLADSVYIPQWLSRKGVGTVACDSLCESVDSMAELRGCGAAVVGVPDLCDLFWPSRPAMPVSRTNIGIIQLPLP